jgi:hypothetical protein
MMTKTQLKIAEGLTAAAFVIAAFLLGQHSQPKPLAPSLPQCQTEDSVNCYWDAQHQGNHQGQSFVNLNGHTWYASNGDPWQSLGAPAFHAEDWSEPSASPRGQWCDQHIGWDNTNNLDLLNSCYAAVQQFDPNPLDAD